MTPGSADIRMVTGQAASPAEGEGQDASPVEPLTRAQFAEEFSRSSRTLWCVAAAVLRDRSRADDVLQEAAIIGLRKLDEYTPGGSFVAWMSQIVRYVALNEGRKEKRRRTHGMDPEALASMTTAEPTRSRGETEGELDAHVQEAMDELPEAARVCLILRTVREMSYADIAVSLGIPEGTAMNHVHRARKMLREKLENSLLDRDME